MSEGSGFLEFFILEASDYVEQLDGLLLNAGPRGPDGDAVQRIARALRGTATMAKLPTFAELAGAVERVGRALHERVLEWDSTLDGVLVSAIDDLKVLLHKVRTWSPEEDRRATGRAAELAHIAPPRPRSGASTDGRPSGGASAAAFLATEAANIAAGVELITARAGDRDTAANVMHRVRALRGVAGVKEVAPLAAVLEATEEAGRPLETIGEPLSAEARRLLEASAEYLRMLSTALRAGGDVNAPSAARDAFDVAAESWATRVSDSERVVPIADLFFPDDAGVIEAAHHPPTTASDRFRLELVSRGENLRQVIDSARAAKDASSIARAHRELRRSLRGLEAVAESFGETEVADFIRDHELSPDNLDLVALGSLDELASLVSEPGQQGERLRAKLRGETPSRGVVPVTLPVTAPEELRSGAPVWAIQPEPSEPLMRDRSADVVVPVSEAPAPIAEAPPPAPEPEVPAPLPPPIPDVVRATPQSPRAAERLDPGAAGLIDSTIAALEAFTAIPMLQPNALSDEELSPVVPIETLLYSGRAALDRAVEIRDELRHAGVGSDPEALEELFDLLELARGD